MNTSSVAPSVDGYRTSDLREVEEAALAMMVIPSIALALDVQKYIVEGFARALIIG